MRGQRSAFFILSVSLVAVGLWTCQPEELAGTGPIGAEDPSNLPSYLPAPSLPPLSHPFTYQVPARQSPWPDYNASRIYDKVVGPTSVQESPTLQLEVRKEYGASIQIRDKVTNQPLINFYDLGRETGMTSYGGPRSFADDSPRWKNIGYNPLQAGDDGMNPSPILFHGFINGWIYTKAQCLSWAHQDARLLPFYYEQWVRLDGNKVHVRVRLTHERPDKTFYGAEEQEWPMMMINGARKVHFYNGSSPYTYDKTTVTDGIETKRSDGSYLLHQGTPFGLTEPWQAVEFGANPDGVPRLIGLYCSDYFWANYTVAGVAAAETWEGGNTHTYTSNRPMAHLDSDNTWHKEYTYIVGTEQEIRDYVYAQERINRPDFMFNLFNGRSGWVIIDGGFDQKEPFVTNNWQVTFTGKTENGLTNARGTKLVSPTGSWKASSFQDVYIRMAYSGRPGSPAQQQLRLTWLLNGQAPDGVDDTFPTQNRLRFPRGVRKPAEQSVPLTVFNDGKLHTYKISFAGHPMWKDIIQRFDINHPDTPSFVAPGEVITLAYFGYRNPGN
ncbi:hypothetical protein HNV11_13015 [Spirosoma taeanense]|uniref:Uncharacterized protein n=1 Tax=Spirosoma taeanense TaxID=2735870 RepID=A0A6M5YAH8_9BACT|nr:hypothetical protein [Spirosoma taeanense]QJW90231.1 hypothetical protein HNV11_13015 [Spirosoma taeanense]